MELDILFDFNEVEYYTPGEATAVGGQRVPSVLCSTRVFKDACLGSTFLSRHIK